MQISLQKEQQKEIAKTQKEQEDILAIQQKITREIDAQRHLSLRSLDSLSISTISEDGQGEQSSSYDVFISHASEDKEFFVRPFAECLRKNGLKVWYDEFELKIGDSLRRKIDEGLRKSRFGIVVLSAAFFSKEWPQKELDGLFARESTGEEIILPIWHKISKDEVMHYSLTIADKLALNTSSFSTEEIAAKIIERVRDKK